MGTISVGRIFCGGLLAAVIGHATTAAVAQDCRAPGACVGKAVPLKPQPVVRPAKGSPDLIKKRRLITTQPARSVGPARQPSRTIGPARGTPPVPTQADSSKLKPPVMSKPTGPAREVGQPSQASTSTGPGSNRGSPEPETKQPSKTTGPAREAAPDKSQTADTGAEKAAKKRPSPAPDDTPKATTRREKADEPASPAKAAKAPSVPTAKASTVTTAALSAAAFSHNNSTMKVVPEGDAVRVVYDKPKAGLEGLGIKPGTPLFEGKKTGPNSYAGEATTFSRNCGTATFPVKGDAKDGTITLRGQKPVRNSDCKVAGYTSETLVFEAK